MKNRSHHEEASLLSYACALSVSHTRTRGHKQTGMKPRTNGIERNGKEKRGILVRGVGFEPTNP